VLERRDPHGNVAWAKRLADLFSPAQVAAFTDLGGARVWTWGWWLDAADGEVVVLARGGFLRRLALSDGRSRDAAGGPDEESRLRARVATGRESERRSALAAAEERRVSGLVPVLEGQLAAAEGRTEAWRVDVAAALLRGTDHAGAWTTLLAALAPTSAEDVRRRAALALHRALPSATPERRSEVLERARGAASAEARWLLENC
jgi:hypothetical protein